MVQQDLQPVTAPNLWQYEDAIDTTTRWWNSYPPQKFKHLAKPKESFRDYVKDVFNKPKGLVRSASAVNLTFIKEADVSHSRPLHKSPSFSALSPSHALYPGDRYAFRYFSSSDVYKPAMQDYHTRHFMPRRYVEARAYTAKRDYIPDFAARWRTPLDRESYVTGSQRYMNRYILDRGRVSAGEARYAYRQHHDSQVDHRWLRFPAPTYGTFVGTSTAVPRLYEGAWHPFRLYRLKHRHLF